MVAAQRSVELRVIGSISCDRVTFKKVRQMKTYKCEKSVEQSFGRIVIQKSIMSQKKIFVLHVHFKMASKNEQQLDATAISMLLCPFLCEILQRFCGENTSKYFPEIRRALFFQQRISIE